MSVQWVSLLGQGYVGGVVHGFRFYPVLAVCHY